MIFEDLSHRRWQITRFIGLLLLVVGVSFGTLYLYSSYRTFVLPATADMMSVSPSYDWLSVYQGVDVRPTKVPPADQTMQRRAGAVSASPFSIKTLQKQAGYLAVGFLVQTDKAGLASFASHANQLDVVIPDWYSLAKNSTSSCAITQHIDENVRALLHQHATAIIPRISNGDADGWHVHELRAILRAPDKRSCLAQSIANTVKQTDSKGINIDFEGLTLEDRPFLTEFFIELTERIHAQKQLLTVDIPVNAQAFDLHALSILSDATILMAYDQHDPTSGPGPMAAQDWVKASLAQALEILPAEKTILGTANGSYDWTIDTPNIPAFSTSYRNALQLAKDVSAKPEMDTVSQNFHFGYEDEQDRRHDVWFLDANTLWNEHLLIQSHALLGGSLWRLGLEDPFAWSFFGTTTTEPLAQVTDVAPVDGRLLNHESEVYSLTSGAQTGSLQRRSSPEGEVLSAQYLLPPTSYTVKRIGQPIADGQVVLTFANDLDQTWTPKILDLLSEQKIPAVFYLTREQIRQHASLVKELTNRGFSIGSTVPVTKPEAFSFLQLQTDLHDTQRELISVTGKKTTLFQAPLIQNTTLFDQDDAHTLPVVTRLGYVSIDAGIDLVNDPSTSLLDQVTRAERQLVDTNNHIISVRNVGGEQTLALLNLLIPDLKKNGRTFTSLHEAIQIPLERLQPNATTVERIQSTILRSAELIQQKQWIIIAWIFLFTNVLSVIRILFLAWFVLRSKHIKKRPSTTTRETLVTVVIPAYNEEKTIRRTVASVQHSTHKNFVALVVNDGSSDKTAAIVEHMRQKDPRIQLLNKPNGGKFSALNLAFQQATTDLIITIDADTILHPKTLDELIMPFDDPKVDAVCGNVEVGNICNLLTGFQALEYITSQNFDRRAFEELNCIGVVPGATGAWRRQRVIEIGGYEADTLVEDADVTLRLLKHGGKIVYAPEARSRTEAPSTLKDLSKQRLRWSFGTFQCLRKHARSFFHGTLGWIALPNIFFFQILYPILSPIGDLVFIWAIVTRQVNSIIVGYLFFILVDFVGSVLAFRLEKRSPKLLLLIFIQRFFYRQFMYVIAFRSILAILRGTHQGWNKLVRKGSVHATFRKKLAQKLTPKLALEEA